jgi:hypothetical protein
MDQKRPLKPKHVWAIRVRPELAENHRDLTLCNMAMDSKRRSCDLICMKVVDVMATKPSKEWAEQRVSRRQNGHRSCKAEGKSRISSRFVKNPTEN